MPWIPPGFSDSRRTVAPAASTALRGSVSSTCSTLSVGRMVMVLPSRDLAMGNPVRLGGARAWSGGHGHRVIGLHRPRACLPAAEPGAADGPAAGADPVPA